MKNYDPNIRWGLHTIKVSFQRGVYKGFVTFVKSGNCKGLDVLGIDEEDLYDMKFKENPINFRLLGEDDNGDEWFAMTLKNDKKDEFGMATVFLTNFIRCRTSFRMLFRLS
ncbi:TPA: DUF5406 family protein, partial [Enterococcus faecalis]